MKKPPVVIIKKRPKIPKELVVYFTPETKFEIVKPGRAHGLPSPITAKPHSKAKE